MKTTSTTETQTAGFIYIEVPHQMPAKCYVFESEAEFDMWLRRCAPQGFGMATYTRDEWVRDTEGCDETWIAKGIALFDAGAKQVCVMNADEVSEGEIVDAKTAPAESEAILEAMRRDLHAAYVCDHDRALAILNGSESISHHQELKVRAFIRDAAHSLGWL